MKFDDKFMSVLGMLGGLKGNGTQPHNGLALVSGLLSAMGGNNKGLDFAKILPLLASLKGENPLSNAFASAPTQEREPTIKDTPKGFNDKYDAITFAGNEVIYSLGKLWKVREI